MDLRPGTTPIIFMSNYIAAKLENKNPSGSIKDRIVEMKLNDLKGQEIINRKMNLLSVLNGEFAVSFAYFCAKKGFKCYIICPKSINKNHLSLCKMYGAEIIFSESNNYKSMMKQKDVYLLNKTNFFYVDFYEKDYLKKMYESSLIKELNLQIQASHKHVKNIFLYSESGVLAEALKDKFAFSSIYNVKITNGWLNFNGAKRDLVNNMNIMSEDKPSSNLFKKEIEIKLDKVIENIKDVSKKSGLLMDYRTSACYLAAKDYPCSGGEVALIFFYENGERYIDELFLI